MYRSSEIFKTIYTKGFDINWRSGVHKNNQKYFYVHFSKSNKSTAFRKTDKKAHARTSSKRKKNERTIKLKEKLKIIVFSSIYLFTADYLYHVYFLKDTPGQKGQKNKRDENEIKGENEKNENIGIQIKKIFNLGFKKTEKEDSSGQYLKKESSGESGINDENNNTWNINKHNEAEKLKKRNISNEKLPSAKERNNKKNNEEENTIKINRIHKKQSNDSTSSEEDFFNRLSREWKNSEISNNEKNEQEKEQKKKKESNLLNDNNNDKKIINNTSSIEGLYRQHFLNGCNLFLFANGIVFFLWRLSDLTKNKKLHYFMCRHFVCSYENIKKKHYHTFLTASISHITFPHFIFNTYAFYFISNILTSPEIKENKKKYFFFNYKSNTLERKITDVDIINVCFLSSTFSTLSYVLLNKKNQVLGASGVIMGLLYVLSTVKPNEIFISVFPFPYLKLTALQLCHVTILTNFIFAFLKKNLFNIAWSAHLFGFLGGAIYNIYQRKRNNFSYYPFWELSLANGKIDYLNSYYDSVDFFQCLSLKIKMLFTLDHEKEKNLNKKIATIKFMQVQRRMRSNEQKRKNLEAILHRLTTKK